MKYKPTSRRVALLHAAAIIVFATQPADATDGSHMDNAPIPLEQHGRWKELAANGSAAAEFKHYDQAISFFNAALEQSPNQQASAYLYRCRGDAYRGKGETQLAMADYHRTIAVQPKDANDFLTRGGTYEKLGNYKAAASDYEKGLALAPGNTDGLNALACLKATAPDAAIRDGREAIRIATKACELTRWRDADIIDTLAAAHAETGDFAQAITFEQQAIRGASDKQRTERQERLALYQKRKPYRLHPG